MTAATIIRRFAPKANSAASRIARLSCRPVKLSTPAIQSTGPLSPLSVVKITAEMATPKDAPSDEAIL